MCRNIFVFISCGYTRIFDSAAMVRRRRLFWEMDSLVMRSQVNCLAVSYDGLVVKLSVDQRPIK